MDDHDAFNVTMDDHGEKKSPLSVSAIDSPSTPIQECHDSSFLQQCVEEEENDNDGGDASRSDDDNNVEDEFYDVSDLESEDTAGLLEQAKDRLQLQAIQEEVKHLKEILAQKDVEIRQLSEQFRDVMASKCDLVLAQNELDKNHRESIKCRDEGLVQLKKAYVSLLEEKSKVEMEMLNEICELTERIKELQAQHEKDDKEREARHRSEIAMKDTIISCLREELRHKKVESRDPVVE